uniref:Uncharacterized protein n=1 Tax=Lotharella globosa TaxID=91324 RepID=A0A7S3Z7R6_9EUKA
MSTGAHPLDAVREKVIFTNTIPKEFAHSNGTSNSLCFKYSIDSPLLDTWVSRPLKFGESEEVYVTARYIGINIFLAKNNATTCSEETIVSSKDTSTPLVFDDLQNEFEDSLIIAYEQANNYYVLLVDSEEEPTSTKIVELIMNLSPYHCRVYRNFDGGRYQALVDLPRYIAFHTHFSSCSTTGRVPLGFFIDCKMPFGERKNATLVLDDVLGCEGSVNPFYIVGAEGNDYPLQIIHPVETCDGDDICTVRSMAPSSMPTTSTPTLGPTSPKPTSQPSRQPSSQPSRQPSLQPSRQPTTRPTSSPSSVEVSTQIVNMEMIFETMQLSSMTETEQSNFEDMIVDTLTNAYGVSEEEVEITAIVQGSIIVDATINSVQSTKIPKETDIFTPENGFSGYPEPNVKIETETLTSSKISSSSGDSVSNSSAMAVGISVIVAVVVSACLGVYCCCCRRRKTRDNVGSVDLNSAIDDNGVDGVVDAVVLPSDKNPVSTIETNQELGTAGDIRDDNPAPGGPTIQAV